MFYGILSFSSYEQKSFFDGISIRNIGEKLLRDAEISPEHPEGSSEDQLCNDNIVSKSKETPKVQPKAKKKKMWLPRLILLRFCAQAI